MSTNVNVSVFLKFHEEDESCIVDGGHFPYPISVEHHDVGKASQIRREGISVETSSFSNTTNMGLNRLYREHFVHEGSEVMIYISMSKNIINVLHFNVNFMALNPTV